MLYANHAQTSVVHVKYRCINNVSFCCGFPARGLSVEMWYDGSPIMGRRDICHHLWAHRAKFTPVRGGVLVVKVSGERRDFRDWCGFDIETWAGACGWLSAANPFARKHPWTWTLTPYNARSLCRVWGKVGKGDPPGNFRSSKYVEDEQLWRIPGGYCKPGTHVKTSAICAQSCACGRRRRRRR